MHERFGKRGRLRGLRAAAIAASVMTSATAARAVSVFTPAIEVNSDYRAACYVLSVNASTVSVTLNLRDDTGTVQATTGCSLALGQSCEAALAPGSLNTFYCEAVASSSTIADNLRLNVAREGQSNSNAFGAKASLRGSRTGISSSVLTSPALNGGINLQPYPSYVCRVVNASTNATTSTVTISLFYGDGSGTAQSFLTIGALQSVAASLSTNSGSFFPGFCQVSAPSSTMSKLRTSFYIRDVDGDAQAPVDLQ